MRQTMTRFMSSQASFPPKAKDNVVPYSEHAVEAHQTTWTTEVPEEQHAGSFYLYPSFDAPAEA